MPPKKTPRAAKPSSAAPPSRKKTGTTRMLFTITTEHREALRREAFDRAAAAGSAKPDASAVLREVLDAWVAKRR